MFLERYNDEKSASRAASKKASDPKNISPTIAFGKEPPSTSELIEFASQDLERIRFQKCLMKETILTFINV